MEDKIKQILSDIGFVESEDKKGDRIFEIKDGILTVSVLKSDSNETINEEIRQAREHLLKELDMKILTLCTIDDSGGILISGKDKIGEINRIDGVMKMNLAKVDELSKLQ